MLPSTPTPPLQGRRRRPAPRSLAPCRLAFLPADDYMERSLDLNEELIHRPHATFFSGPPDTPWSGRVSMTAIC